MKKTIFLFLTLVISANVLSQDLLQESKELGLISYLTTVKSVAEFKMISLASDPQYKTEMGKVVRFQSEYNLLKLSVDRLINQMVADMTAKNRLQPYKIMNKYIMGDIKKLPESMNPYNKVTEEIEGRLETFLLKTYSSMLSGPSIEEVLGIVELTHGIITDARDFREKKITNIATQLTELKLKPLKELTEEKEK